MRIFASSLHQKLKNGQLKSIGRRTDGPDEYLEIPAIEWELLHLAPPLVYDARKLSHKIQPWTDIRVESAQMKKLWRSTSEVKIRTKYDWDELYIKKAHPVLEAEPCDYLFPVQDGGPKSPTHLSRLMKETILEHTGLTINAHL